MANNKSSIKRIIQSKKKKKHNSCYKSMIKTFIKKNFLIINNKNITLAKNFYIKTQKILDRQSLKNIIHKNKASRYKSIISKKINKM
ncbi:30S ribosomal protein S20 [Enterobacterales bacterium endosymbiont of Anomoneura mori]|uniref:30S ribosomal protein S20 n=1 Tax=Enterobacterales bacterium endosymbiont of Anomoneura mori TaxID=3132096 RepID=UPI00399CDF62